MQLGNGGEVFFYGIFEAEAKEASVISSGIYWSGENSQIKRLRSLAQFFCISTVLEPNTFLSPIVRYTKFH